MGRFFFTGMLMCVLCIACKDDRQDNKAQGLLVKIQAAYHIKVLFQQQGYNGDSTINIDSAIVQSGLDTLRFNFPAGNERVFLITLQGTGIHIPVINDSKNVELYYNYATRRYGFTNSAASTSLQQLGYAQVKLATRARMLKEWVDSAGKRNAEPALVKDSLSLLKNMNRD
ncbi:MAG TPA: hypothetical protein VHB48_18725, partial [Chitinophagaceae bacterium]|nr:hypothetical protein [Chitinophagaceae bacterium]